MTIASVGRADCALLPSGALLLSATILSATIMSAQAPPTKFDFGTTSAPGSTKVAPATIYTTDQEGAEINADRVIAGLMKLQKNPLAAYFSAKGRAVKP
jgi:hypothetical protein